MLHDIFVFSLSNLFIGTLSQVAVPDCYHINEPYAENEIRNCICSLFFQKFFWRYIHPFPQGTPSDLRIRRGVNAGLLSFTAHPLLNKILSIWHFLLSALFLPSDAGFTNWMFVFVTDFPSFVFRVRVCVPWTSRVSP